MNSFKTSTFFCICFLLVSVALCQKKHSVADEITRDVARNIIDELSLYTGHSGFHTAIRKRGVSDSDESSEEIDESSSSSEEDEEEEEKKDKRVKKQRKTFARTADEDTQDDDDEKDADRKKPLKNESTRKEYKEEAKTQPTTREDSFKTTTAKPVKQKYKKIVDFLANIIDKIRPTTTDNKEVTRDVKKKGRKNKRDTKSKQKEGSEEEY